MKMNNIFFRFIFMFSIVSLYANAQAPTFQDCLGAIPVCQSVYKVEQIPNGYGTYQEFDVFDGCIPIDENSTWYTFIARSSGNFGFLITPNEPTDDYDWVLFDITNVTCVDILNNSNKHVVSCNNAGDNYFDEPYCNGPTGATGATSFVVIREGCEHGNSPFNDFVPVQEGNIYMLLIVNWTQSPFGYEIDFSLGDTVIFDEGLAEDTIPPIIKINEDDFVKVALGDTAFTAPPATAYDNNDCEVEIVIDASQLNLNVEGSYDIIYSAADSNNNTTVKIVTIVVETVVNIEAYNSSPITVYPNPATNFIYADLNGGSATNIILYSTDGQLVLNETLNRKTGNLINISSLSKGIYLYKVINNQNLLQLNKLIIN